MQYNYSDEEMQFLKMNLKLREELGRVNYEIDRLEDRRRDLIALIDAEIDLEDLQETEEPQQAPVVVVTEEADPTDLLVAEEPFRARVDKALLRFVRNNPGVRRAEIIEVRDELAGGIDVGDIDRSISRLRKHGKIINEGRGKASKWYAVEGA